MPEERYLIISFKYPICWASLEVSPQKTPQKGWHCETDQKFMSCVEPWILEVSGQKLWHSSLSIEKPASKHPRIPKVHQDATTIQYSGSPKSHDVQYHGARKLGSHTVSAPRPFQQRGHSCGNSVEVFGTNNRIAEIDASHEDHHFPTFGDFISKQWWTKTSNK